MDPKSSRSPLMQDEIKYTKAGIKSFFIGLAMGGADIIPGVSGGTVALILGVYHRLVLAISRFDLHLVKLIAQRKFALAAKHIDLRFLLVLGSGVVVGIVSLAKLMQILLQDYRSYTLAAFFGLILASSYLVAKLAREESVGRNLLNLMLGLVAARLAYLLVGSGVLEAKPGYAYTFLCGAIAICAMILPGISGAYVLLILGKYHSITEKIHLVTSMKANPADFLELAILAAGCVVGLILFSKLLKWLLSVQMKSTMAVLCGFMLGSLRKIWPFQIDLTPDRPFSEKIYQNTRIELWNSEVVICLLISLGAILIVVIAEYIAEKNQTSTRTDLKSDRA